MELQIERGVEVSEYGEEIGEVGFWWGRCFLDVVLTPKIKVFLNTVPQKTRSLGKHTSQKNTLLSKT